MQTDTLKDSIITALRVFVRQRPGLEYGNYGDPVAYRAEMRGITRDLGDAEFLLRRVEMAHGISGQDMLKAATGRLSVAVVRRWECASGHKYAAPVKLSNTTPNLSGESTAWCPKCGARPVIGSPQEIEIDYCTGQYWPVEYRPAVARFCAELLWAYRRDRAMPASIANKGDYLRQSFRREYGRSLARRYFS